MADSTDEDRTVGLSKDGFVKWRKQLEHEGKVETGGTGPTITSGNFGIIPGFEFYGYLKPFIGKRIKITIEVYQEL